MGKFELTKEEFECYIRHISADGKITLRRTKTRICEDLGCSRGTLLNWMKKNGYEKAIKTHPEHLRGL